MTPQERKRNSHLFRTYGITLEEYDDLLRKQDEKCAVCMRHYTEFSKNLAVDHDHTTGEVRGLLCTYCNQRVVGRYKRETAEFLLRAYTYLTGVYTGMFVPKKSKKRRSKRKLTRNIKT